MLSIESIRKFWVSGNFPETVWRTMNCRQATHLILLVFWVPERNRLVVSFVPPGDACQTNPIVGFCLSCLAVMNTRQATRTNFGSVLVFWVF